MDWSTLALGIGTISIVVFIIGGLRVSRRSGMLGASLLANIGLSKAERSARREQFWAALYGADGGLDRWLVFGGAACCVGAILALGALAG